MINFGRDILETNLNINVLFVDKEDKRKIFPSTQTGNTCSSVSADFVKLREKISQCYVRFMHFQMTVSLQIRLLRI